MKKFLLINPFGIGDILFTTPLIRAIKDASKDNQIYYWCNQRVSDILKDNPDISKIFALSRGDLKKISQESKLRAFYLFLKLLCRIKKEKFAVVIDLSLDQRYGLITKVLGIKKRVGFNYKNRGLFLTDRINIDGYTGKHVVEYYLDLLYFIGIKPCNKNLKIFVTQKNEIHSRSLFTYARINDNELLIGIAPAAGASWGGDAVLKHWPAIRYAQLADKLIDEFHKKIVILGDLTEKPISEIVIAAMKNKPFDLTGKLTLEELIAVIKKLRLLIANDGGPLHIAVAAGVPTISIFGPVDEKVYGPYPASGKHTVIKSGISCRPCYRKFRLGLCENNKECINAITVSEVFDAVKKQLS